MKDTLEISQDIVYEPFYTKHIEGFQVLMHILFSCDDSRHHVFKTKETQMSRELGLEIKKLREILKMLQEEGFVIDINFTGKKNTIILEVVEQPHLYRL